MADLYVIDRDGERVLVPRLHADRHLTGGADEIDGDKLDIDWNPSNYTPATTPSQADNVDNLAAHLYGIDQALGGISAAIICDEKSAGTDGGTFSSGAWRTRDLNTEISDPDAIVSISSNEFTLGAGDYLIEWSAPGFVVSSHQSRLYDVTGTAVVESGTSEEIWASSADASRSFGAVLVSPGSSNAYRIEHRCETSQSGYGFGRAANFGEAEKYTMVKITKLG